MMPQTTHRLAAMVLVVATLTTAAQAQEARLVPVAIDGERARLEMRVYEPADGAPAPSLVCARCATSRPRWARSWRCRSSTAPGW